MNSKILGAALFLLLAPGFAVAGNDGLARLQAVPAGERVAGFLQSYMNVIGAVVESKGAGGILDGVQTYRVVVVYDGDARDLEVTLIGVKRDPPVVQSMLGAVQKIILGLNPKIQRDFGVTLQANDLSMDYLYAKSGRVLMRYRDGKYLGGPPPAATPSPGPAPSSRPNKGA